MIGHLTGLKVRVFPERLPYHKAQFLDTLHGKFKGLPTKIRHLYERQRFGARTENEIDGGTAQHTGMGPGLGRRLSWAEHQSVFRRHLTDLEPPLHKAEHGFTLECMVRSGTSTISLPMLT